MIERIKTRARDFEQCGEIASVLIKGKRLGRFSPPDLQSNSEQCGGIMRVSYHTARRKRRTVCPHKESQSAFIPFITSERMRYESLRTDKRKTLGRFSPPDFIKQIRAVAVRGTSVYRSLPYFCFAKIRGCRAKMRHGIRAVH